MPTLRSLVGPALDTLRKGASTFTLADDVPPGSHYLCAFLVAATDVTPCSHGALLVGDLTRAQLIALRDECNRILRAHGARHHPACQPELCEFPEGCADAHGYVPVHLR